MHKHVEFKQYGTENQRVKDEIKREIQKKILRQIKMGIQHTNICRIQLKQF